MSDTITKIVGEVIKGYELSISIGKRKVLASIEFIKYINSLRIKIVMRMNTDAWTWVPVFEGEAKATSLTAELMENEASKLVGIYAEPALPKLLRQQELDKIEKSEQLAKLVKTEALIKEELIIEEVKVTSEIDFKGHVYFEKMKV